MGCGDSKGLTARETTNKNKTAQQNLSKKEESKAEEKKTTKNNITLTENNLTKEDTNKVHGNNEHRDKINLVYYAKYRANWPIFGKNFVNGNKDNIDLIVNGKHYELTDKYLLEEDNIVTIVIKNKLTDLSGMFERCYYLKDFSELKYLDVSHAKSFSHMFYGCTQITDINFL